MADSVLIALLAHSRPDMARDAFRSIMEHTVHPFELIVINNGGGSAIDGVFCYPFDFDIDSSVCTNALYLRSQENVGLAAGYNLALRIRKPGQHFVRFNEDAMVLRSGWLTDLLTWLERLPDAGELMHWYIESGRPMRMVPEWIEEVGEGWMRTVQATSCVILETAAVLDTLGGFFAPPDRRWYSVCTEFSARARAATNLRPYFVSTGPIERRNATRENCWAVHRGPVRKYRWEKDNDLCERLRQIRSGEVPLRIDP